MYECQTSQLLTSEIHYAAAFIMLRLPVMFWSWQF